MKPHTDASGAPWRLEGVAGIGDEEREGWDVQGTFACQSEARIHI